MIFQNGAASEEEIAASIRDDMTLADRHGRLSTFVGIRTGLKLIWLKENGDHGDLTPFIKKHFGEKSRRTLSNYMSVANEFLADAKLRNPHTRKLTDSDRLAEITQVQLDLFITPEAEQMKNAVGKLAKWVGKQTLSQIYKRLAKGDASAPPTQRGKKPADKRSEAEIKREAALMSVGSLELFAHSDDWHFLEDEELSKLGNVLTAFNDAVGAMLKQREAVAAKAGRRRS